MVKKLLIRDVSLRDSQQALFASRISQSQIEELLPAYKNVGFYAVDMWGGSIPDTLMRYLNEDPWARIERTKYYLADSTKLAALIRGRNLLGYTPFPDNIIKDFCMSAIDSGINIIRTYDALNDLDNIKSSVKYIHKFGGLTDCALCYTIDPHFSAEERIISTLQSKPLPRPVFTNEYYVTKAIAMENMGADIVTLEDLNGLMPPARTAEIVHLLKKHLKVPVDFHSHCTAGYALASMLMAILNGVDIIDTSIWYFAGGNSAPAIELIYVFCKKLGIELEINMDAIAQINARLFKIRKELANLDTEPQLPISFNPLTDALPTEIDRFFNDAIEAARNDKENDLILFCHAIEQYFNFPAPNEICQGSNIPVSMYNHISSHLRKSNKQYLLESAMRLIPHVRIDAGLPPLVPPITKIIGSQAINCAINKEEGKPLYDNPTFPFVALIRGEFGKTPIEIKPEFREKITGSREEEPFIPADYTMQENDNNVQLGRPLAENQKEILLLELFPTMAESFLLKRKTN